MSINKIKQFVADHKKELIATTVVVGGCVLVVFGCKYRMRKRGGKPNGALKQVDVVIPEGLKVWNTTMLWHEGKYLNGIIENIPMDDLGELGKQFIENGLAQPGDIASVIIGVESNK